VSDGVSRYLVALVPVLVDQAVVSGGVGDEVGGSDGAVVGVPVGSIEQAAVELFLRQGREAVIKGEINNLRPGVQVRYYRLLTATVTVRGMAGIFVTARTLLILA